MSQVRFTKNALRDEQRKLSQLEKYLPTLQLKKGLLQAEVQSTKGTIGEKLRLLEDAKRGLDRFSALFATDALPFSNLLEVTHVSKSYENIAGVESPVFQGVTFPDEIFSLFDTPAWSESALCFAKDAIKIREEIAVLEEKKRNVEKELRDVSIRVNLFEKILIPRSRILVQKIRVFLGDQELASVAQAKIAKKKTEEKRERL
ncbi:MAG: V-type ATP synthase subunit D [Chlamydiota bacterium]